MADAVRYLRHKVTGELFVWTPALDALPEMERADDADRAVKVAADAQAEAQALIYIPNTDKGCHAK